MKTNSRALSSKKIEEMWVAYQKQPTAVSVAQATGVHRTTVTRYIKEGDPARGIQPFRERLRGAMENAVKKADDSIMLDIAETLEMAKQWKAALKKKMKTDPEKIRVTDFEKIARLELDLLTAIQEKTVSSVTPMPVIEEPDFPEDFLHCMAFIALEYGNQKETPMYVKWMDGTITVPPGKMNQDLSRPETQEEVEARLGRKSAA